MLPQEQYCVGYSLNRSTALRQQALLLRFNDGRRISRAEEEEECYTASANHQSIYGPFVAAQVQQHSNVTLDDDLCEDFYEEFSSDDDDSVDLPLKLHDSFCEQKVQFKNSTLTKDVRQRMVATNSGRSIDDGDDGDSIQLAKCRGIRGRSRSGRDRAPLGQKLDTYLANGKKA